MIRYGSCRTLFHKEGCDFYVVLDEDFCGQKENSYCLPVQDFTVHPFTNVVAATALTVDLAREGNVCVCDKGGCGRSGTVAGMALAYFNSDMNFAQLKKLLRNEYNLLRECPEKPEQEEAIRLAWATFHYFGTPGFKLLARTSFVYTYKPSPKDVAGAFVVHVTNELSKKAKFVPVRALGRRLPYGREVEIEVKGPDAKKVEEFMGEATSTFFEEYAKVRGKGRVVKLEELAPEEVEPYALAYAALEGSIFRVLDHREALVLIAKSGLV